MVFADFDSDGDTDVFEQLGGAFLDDTFGNALFENPGLGGHRLTVELVGTTSNRSAIGARIRAEFDDRGERRTVYRHVSSGGSFGANPLRQILGLGGAEIVDRREVLCPTTGKVEVFEQVPADRTVRLIEGVGTLEEIPLASVQLGAAGRDPRQSEHKHSPE